ncbi:MAG: glycosyltransferase, partial [Rubrobacter sp.]|nr:glycosyltransferase [Rubrobacter sp.]
MRPEEKILAGEQANKRRAANERSLLTLVIPTRNEVSNVPHLVRELKDALSGVDYRVVFVDDSNDGTPEVIRALSEEDGRILLIHRE